MSGFGVDLKFNTTYEGVQEGKRELESLKQVMDSIGKEGVKINLNEQEVSQAKMHIEALERSIKEAEKTGGNFGEIFKRNLGSVQTELGQTSKATQKTEKSFKDLEKTAKSSGGGGFTSVSKAAKLATQDIRGTQTQMDKLRTNLEQGLGQTIAFGAIGAVAGSFMSALDVAKELDTVSTDISIVSGKTREEMEGYRDASISAADALSSTTQKYMEASLIYEQQGGEAAYYAKELADATVVASNISRESTSQMSEYLTATINGFQLLKEKGGDAGIYLTDVMSKLGAASGSDLAEIATGLTRTANTAKDVGFEFEEIATMIATVSEVTRRTPETIGNAFKSMLTSFTQLREAGADEVEAFTNKIENAFKLGGIEDISVFDNGNLREASDIFKDVASRWEQMNVEQQSLVSEAIAGKYQAETFRAFMGNQERYTDLLGEAYGSAGTAAQQQLVYADSLEAKTNELKNAWQGAVNTIVDSNMFKGVLEDLTNLVKLVGTADSGLGGLAIAMAPLAGIGGNFFLAPKIAEVYSNSQINKSQVDVGASVDSLGLEKAQRDELVAVKEKEIARGKELNQITRALGESASAQYSAMREEAEKLGESLLIVTKAQEDPNFAKKVAEDQMAGGQGGYTKGFNSPQLKEDSLAIIEKQNVYLKEESELLSVNNAKLDESLAIREEMLVLQMKDEKAGNKSEEELDEIIVNLQTWRELYEDITHLSVNLSEEEKEINQGLQARISNLWEEDFLNKDKLTKTKEIANTLEDVALIEKRVKEELTKNVNLERERVKEATKKRDIAATTLAAEKQIAAAAKGEQSALADQKILQAQLAQQDKIAKRTNTLRQGIGALTTAYAAVVPMVAAYSAAQDGTLSKQEAVITGMQGLSGALISSFNPWAMAAGVAIGAISMIVDAVEPFKTEVEKATEANENLIKSLISLRETADGKLGNLRGVAESYASFAGVNAADFVGSAPSKDDTEAYAEYNKKLDEYQSLAAKLIDVKPELLQYYTAEGIAIVDLTEDYGALLEEQEKLNADLDVMEKRNMTNFAIQYGADLENANMKQDDLNESITRQSQLLKALQDGGASGSDISQQLAAVSFAQSNLAEFQSKLGETEKAVNTNIIQPFLNAADALDLSNQKVNEMKSFLSERFDAKTVGSFLQDGNIDGMEVLAKNLDIITFEFEKLEKSQEGLGSEMIKNLTSSNLLAQQMTLLHFDGSDFNGMLQELEELDSKPMEVLSDRVNESAKGIKEAREELEKFNVGFRNGSLFYSEKEEKTTYTQNNPVVGETQTVSTFNSVANNEELQKSYDLVQGYNEELEKVRTSFEGLSKSSDGFQQGASAIQEMIPALQALQTATEMDKIDGGFLNTETFKTIENSLPSLGTSIRDSFADGADGAIQSMSLIEDSLISVRDTSSQAILGMMGDNSEYYAQWLTNNSSMVNTALDAFGIEASQASTLNELKALLGEQEVGAYKNFAKDKVAVDGEWGKTSEEIREAIAKNNTQRLADEAADVLSTEQLKTIYLEVNEKIRYVEKVGWWEKTKAIFSGDSYYDDQKAYQKKFDEEFQKMVETELGSVDSQAGKYVNDYLKGAGGTKVDLADIVFNDVFSSSEIDFGATSGYLNNSLKEIQNMRDRVADAAGVKKNPSISGSDKDDEKEINDLDLELNRYYKLDNLLVRIQNEYDGLKKKKDAAYGGRRLEYMKEEQAILADQAKVLENYNRELKKEQSETKGSLAGKGFSFSANGEINNLNERLTAMQNHANSLSGEAKEQAIENVKKVQEEAARYSEITFKLIPDKEATIRELKSQMSAISRERIEYKVQLKVDKDDFKSQLFDVLKEMQNQFPDLDEKAQLVGKEMAMSMDNVRYWQQLVNEVKKNKDLTENDRQQLLKEYNKNLLQAVSESRSSYAELLQIQAEFVSKSVEAIDKVAERYDNIISKSQSMVDKNKSLYGTRDIEKITQLYETQEKAIDDQNKHLETARSQMLRYRDSVEKGSEAWKSANDAVNKLSDEISDNLMKKVDLLQSKFQDFSQSLQDDFERMFGPWGLQGAADDFDKILGKQDKYFSNFEKFTNISSMIKDLNDEIAKTSDPERARELAELRDQEFQSLLTQEKVSKTEYERAMKLYDIKQKELALEERRNAKRSVQMVRDSNGNMTYEYIREESEDASKDIAELQKQKDDLYAFDSQQVRDSAQGVFTIIESYQNKIKELQEKGLNPEEFEKELAKLLKDAERDVKDSTTEMNKWIALAGKDGLSNLEGLIKSGAVTPEMLGVDAKTLNDIFNAMSNGTLSIEDMLSGNYGDFANSIGTTSEALKSTMEEMLKLILGDNLEISKAMLAASDKWTSGANGNVTALGDAYNKYMTQADKTLKEYNKSTGSLNTLLAETNKASKEVSTSIKKQTDEMIKTKRETDKTSASVKNLENMLIGANGKSGLYGSMVKLRNTMNNDLQPAERKTAVETEKLTIKVHDNANKFNSATAAASSTYRQISKFGDDKMKKARADIGTITTKANQNAKSFRGITTDATKAKRSVEDFSVAMTKMVQNSPYQSQSASKASTAKPHTTAYPTGYATGGYTGTWSNSDNNATGKLAVLHEKELVLNKADTENILSAVKLQRNLMESIKGRGASVRDTIGTMNSNIRNVQTTNNQETISQPISIYADFPGVSNSGEIERAFDGLYSKASVYIGRKDK